MWCDVMWCKRQTIFFEYHAPSTSLALYSRAPLWSKMCYVRRKFYWTALKRIFLHFPEPSFPSIHFFFWESTWHRDICQGTGVKLETSQERHFGLGWDCSRLRHCQDRCYYFYSLHVFAFLTLKNYNFLNIFKLRKMAYGYCKTTNENDFSFVM